MNKLMRRIILFMVVISVSFTTCVSVPVIASERKLSMVVNEKTKPRLNKTTITLCIGKSQKIYAKKGLSSGDEFVSAKSSNTQIASVSKKGNKAIVKGKKNGSCTITLVYKIDGKKQKLKCKVTVLKPGLSSTKVTLVAGNTKTITIINNGTQNYQLSQVVTSNKKIARVAKKGNKFVVTGVGRGNATISATYKLGKTKKIFKCKAVVSAKDETNPIPDVPMPTLTPTPKPTPDPLILIECIHDYNKVKIKAPSCEKIGFDILKCSKCGEEVYKNLKNPVGHDYEGMICKRCGYEDKKVSSNGHSFVEPVVVEPTCVTEGYSLYECVDHDYEYKSDYVKCLGHNYNQKDENANTFVSAASCTNGSIYKYRCSNCGKIGGDEDVYEKDDCLGHIYNIVSERLSTCEYAGERVEECARCKDIRTTEYPIGEHELSVVSVRSDKTYFECKKCGRILSQDNNATEVENADEEVDADISINDNGMFEMVIPDEWADISKVEMQNESGQMIDLTDHLVRQEGRVTLVLDVSDFIEEDKYLVITDSHGNIGRKVIKKFNQPTINQLQNVSDEDIPEGDASVTFFDIKEPTCVDKGVRRYINITASASIGILDISIPAVGHVPGEPQITKQKEAGCEQEGIVEKTTYCESCGEAVSCVSTVIEATGHRKGEQRTVVYHSGQTSPVDDNDYREYMYYNCLNGCGDEFDKIYFSSTKGDSGIAAIYSSLGYAKAGTKGEVEAELNKYYTFDGWYCNNDKVTNQLCYNYTTTNVANHFEARTTENFLKNTNVTYKENFFDIKKDTFEIYDLVLNDNSKVIATIDPDNLHKAYSIDVKPNEMDAKISYHLLTAEENISNIEDVKKLCWVNTNPQICTWGTYDVYYKIEKDNWRTFYGHSVITINRAQSHANVSLNDWTYGEEENRVEMYSDSLRELYVEEGLNEAVVPSIEFYTDKECTQKTDLHSITPDIGTQSKEGSCPTEAGTYYVQATFPANNIYEECKAVDVFHINKAEGSVVAPIAKTLTYNGTDGNNGSEQVLIEKGSSNTGSLEYSIDKQNWDGTLPKAADAGKYIVYYRVAGDRNHKNVSGDNLYVETIIKKAPGKVSINATSGDTCGNNELHFSVVKNKSGGTILLSSCNSGVAEVYGSTDATVKYISEGSTNITVTSLATDNYESASTNYVATFKKHEDYKIYGGTRVSARSCTVDGVLHYKCSKCNTDVNETYVAEKRTGHNKTKSNNTGIGECGGVVGYYTCFNCGEKGESYDTRYNHTGDNVGDVINQATCRQAGNRYKKCTRCGANYGLETINALGHSWSICSGVMTFKVCSSANNMWEVVGKCNKCSTVESLGLYSSDEYRNRYGNLPSDGIIVQTSSCRYKNYCSRCKSYR